MNKLTVEEDFRITRLTGTRGCRVVGKDLKECREILSGFWLRRNEFFSTQRRGFEGKHLNRESINCGRPCPWSEQQQPF